MRWRCRKWRSARRWADWPRQQRQWGLTDLWGRCCQSGLTDREAHQLDPWGRSGLRNPWGQQGRSDQPGLRGQANQSGLPIQSDLRGQSGL